MLKANNMHFPVQKVVFFELYPTKGFKLNKNVN